MADQGATPRGGARKGARRGPRARRGFSPRLSGLGAGAVAALVAWGFLVWAAIHFGRTARGGDSGAWVFLAVASLGAVACLFLCLLLVTVLLRQLGVLDDPRREPRPPPSPRRH